MRISVLFFIAWGILTFSRGSALLDNWGEYRTLRGLQSLHGLRPSTGDSSQESNERLLLQEKECLNKVAEAAVEVGLLGALGLLFVKSQQRQRRPHDGAPQTLPP